MLEKTLTFEQVAAALTKEELLLFKSGAGLEFPHLSCNSGDVQKGTLFVCKGFTFKREYLEQALAAGACCYLAEEDYGFEVPRFIVSDARRALAVLSALYYGDPAKDIHLIGITGTKGKTTTTFFMKGILDAWLPAPSAVLSTVETYTGGAVEDSHITTPESLELHRDFALCRQNDIHYLTMEVSSQANKLQRVYGVRFDVGMFLNFSEDHIGANEHDDMEDYLRCKLELMKNCATAVIGSGTAELDRVLSAAKESGAKPVTFGEREQDDYRVCDVAKEGLGFCFTVAHGGASERYRIGMEGRFNIMNAVAAIAAATELGVAQAAIAAGIETVSVRGRMNVFEANGVMVLVDYAHNHLSFRELFSSLRQDYPGRRISVVTGCPGGHAFIRRRDIGTLCGEFADHVYLTEEDPQFEEVRDICEEMAEYIQPYGTPYEIILDRTACVEKAVRTAESGDIVILAAKGEETYQKRRGKYVPIESDIAIAKRCLGIE